MLADAERNVDSRLSCVQLRPYQTAMAADIRTAFAGHRRVLAVAPTGSGKTMLFSYICRAAAAKGNRVTIIAHRTEIVDQISRALDLMGVRHGRIQAGHAATDDPVQVAMVVTLGKRLDRVPEPALLIIDESHHATAGSYAKIAEAWQRAKILGVTATPSRLDGKGLGDCFDNMVIGPAMADLIEQGYLARYTYLAPPEKADLSSIKTRGGDFAIDQLAAAMDKAVITGDAIGHYRQHLGGRPAIAFCVTVEHAEHTAEQFRAAGYNAASVDGSMDRAERRDRMAAIGDGRLNVLTSCELISEGVDIPVVAGAILLRPTKSLSMFLQQVGRSLRIKPDGSAAVIIDHVGNVHRHGMPDAPREWSLDRAKRRVVPANAATCEQCYRVFQVAPGWKAEAECMQDRPVGCVLNAPEAAGGKDAPEVVEGTLVVVTNTPDWAGGINLATARGPDFGELLDLAGADVARLKQIAKARKYHHKWVDHVLKNRGARTARAA
jgi:superfamily II DNA or RNA helicase